jgi:hypothetical protein
MRRASGNPLFTVAPYTLQPRQHRFNVHPRSALAGIVLRAMNCAIASAGMRTARPQFTRGSFRLASHALTVEIFRFNASAVSATVSKFFIGPPVSRTM